MFLLDRYFKKLPPYAFEKDVFYLRPKHRAPTTPDVPWYDCVLGGKNKLSTMVRDICSEGGITKKTNHSLRATWATTLFKAGVPEKIIQNTTGHHALRCYERVSDEQHQATSRVLTARDPNVKFNTEMSRVKVQQAKYVESSQSVPLSSVFGQLHGCKYWDN